MGWRDEWWHPLPRRPIAAWRPPFGAAAGGDLGRRRRASQKRLEAAWREADNGTAEGGEAMAKKKAKRKGAGAKPTTAGPGTGAAPAGPTGAPAR